MSQANVTLVQSLYAAFGRGDIAAIVNASAPDIHWEEVGRSTDYPAFGVRNGRAGVQDFFQTVSDNAEFTDFSPREFYAAEDKVFVLGHYAAKMKKTGRMVDADWMHIFTIRNGQVTAFREFTDTAQVAEAYRG
jgi:ketosteroid isomerase-like protein